MSSKTKFTIRQHGGFNTDRLKEAIRKSNFSILVGFPAGIQHVETVHETTEDGERVTYTRGGGELAELAERLFFGDSKMPARPFLRDGLELNQTELKKLVGKELEALRRVGHANLDRIGSEAVAAIQNLIRSGYYQQSAPNAPMTIEAKGSDVPLIDGGNMINSLRYICVQDGKKTSEG